MVSFLAMGMALAALWLLAMSCGLWVYWVVDWLTTARLPFPRWEPSSDRLPVTPLVLTLGYLGLSLLPGHTRPDPEAINLNAGIVVSGLILIVVLAASLFEPARKETLGDRGFRLNAPLEQVNSGMVGMIGAITPVALMLLITIPWRSEATTHPLLQLLKNDPSASNIAKTMLLAVVIAPLSEELMFRVTLQGWLSRYVPAGISIPVVAIVFAAIHGFPDSIPLFPLALMLGYVYHRQRSYLAVVTIHALFNGLNVLMLLAGLQILHQLEPPEQPLPPVLAPDHEMQRPEPVPLPEQFPQSPQSAMDEHV